MIGRLLSRYCAMNAVVKLSIELKTNYEPYNKKHKFS